MTRGDSASRPAITLCPGHGNSPNASPAYGGERARSVAPAAIETQLVQRTGRLFLPRITEYSLGVNYYLYGHNAKIQADVFISGRQSASRTQDSAPTGSKLQTQMMF